MLLLGNDKCNLHAAIRGSTYMRSIRARNLKYQVEEASCIGRRFHFCVAAFY